jgi:hypothetical protein
LARNDRRAEHNRELFRAKGVLVLNVLSSPGSGKARLLERTLSDLISFYLDRGPLPRVVHPAGQSQLTRQPVREGTEAHPLHGPADLDAQPHPLPGRWGRTHGGKNRGDSSSVRPADNRAEESRSPSI